MKSVEAVVLAIQQKNDSSSLVHLYTREYGRILGILYGKKGSSKRSPQKANRSLFTPLSWIDLTLKDSPAQASFFTIQTASYHYVPRFLNTNVKRQFIALFMAEALYKTLQHPLADDRLFDFVTKQIQQLDTADSVEHIHTDFRFQLSYLLGYGGNPIEELKQLKTEAVLKEIL